MAGFNVVEKMVGPDELSNAVSFMAIGTFISPSIVALRTARAFSNRIPPPPPPFPKKNQIHAI